MGLATEQAKEAVISAQEYVKLKVQELQDLKHEIEAKRALGSDEEKAASITEFHEKVMIIQHEIAQTVEQANAGVQKVWSTARVMTCIFRLEIRLLMDSLTSLCRP